jgi:hypothetical protein
MPSMGPAAEAARAEFRSHMETSGHVVDNARLAVVALERAFTDGALVETPVIGAMLADLRVALDDGGGEKLGGKSAEAARFIMRAISRELDAA